MPTSVNIQPFRQLDEANVINLFSYSGTLPVTKGTFVRIISGWDTTQEISELGDVGQHYNDVVSLRYGTKAQVTAITSTGQNILGLLLNDVREYDENGEKLIYNPDKQAAMQCVISGQTVPVATRGMFLYSGISGTVTAGGNAISDGSGGIATSGGFASDVVGKFLGVKDANGLALVWLEL